MVPYGIVLYCVALCYVVLLYCIVLYCIVLYCIVLYCMIWYGRTAIGQRSFVYRAVRLWNELPQAFEAVNTLPNFKAAFKSSALEKFLVS